MNRPPALARLERLPNAAPPVAHSPARPPRPNFLERLSRHRRSMLAVFAVVLTVGLGVASLLAPIYRSESSLALPPDRVAHDAEARLQTLARGVLRGEVLREVAAEHADLLATHTHWLRTYLGWQRTPEQVLRDAASVDVAKPLLLVRVDLPGPSGGATLVDAIVARCLADQQATQTAYEATLRTRLAESDRLQRAITRYNDEMDQIRQRSELLRPEPLVTQQRATLEDLTRRSEELRIQHATVARTLSEVEARLAAQPAPADEALQTRVAEDGRMLALAANLANAREALRVADARYGAAHPERVQAARRVQQLQGQQQSLGQAIRAELLRSPEFAPQRHLDRTEDPQRLREQLARLETEQAGVEALLAQRQRAYEDQFASAETLLRLERDRQAAREALATLQAAPTAAAPVPLKLVAAAQVPHRPVQDARPLVLALFAGSGVLLSLGWGVARVILGGDLRQMGHGEVLFAEHFGSPLGLVNGERPRDTTEFALQAEALRMVRAALLARLPETGGVIQVTSAGPRAGKTGIAIGLAESLAALGKRTLLVDADLRNPGIARRLGLQKLGDDFRSSLQADGPELAGVVHSDTPGMDVLAQGGPVAADEAGVLGRAEVDQLFDRCRAAYDYVIVDSSPVLPVADARLLSQAVDGTVLVVREQHCERDDVLEAVAYLRAAGGRVLGTVFNAGRRSLAFDGAYHYDARGELAADEA